MSSKEKLLHLFEELNESDQKKAYEFIKSLAHHSGIQMKNQEVIQVFGKNYFVVPD
ncbi:hypothetical protein [Paenibacillus xerothermodurans]|uniref:hypothetical protein n=1 Tax=Paenibacillus xerothermodurans TaxID=1977292 RepID=UPI001402373E|nr:hypothetical protein [Paenibacillus xerothermodurans]